MRTELLRLIGAVVAVHALFIGGYFAAGLRTAPPGVRVGFTAVWTAVALAVVLVGLTRVRRARVAAIRGRRRP